MIAMPIPASPQNSSSLTIGSSQAALVGVELRQRLEAVEADLRRLRMIGHGVSSRSSHSAAAGRTTSSAKPWTQSRTSRWSWLSSSENGVAVGGFHAADA